MRYLYPEFYLEGSEFALRDALLCLVKGHTRKPTCLQALEVALSQGYQSIEDGHSHGGFDR